MQAAFLFLAGLTPLLGVFGIMFLLILEYRRRFKTPFIQHLLRPPGESLRLRIDALSEKLMTDALILLIFSMIVGFGLWTIFKHPFVGGVALALSLPPFLYFAHRLWERLRLLRDCNLGFLGERAVGEELNSLLADGWKVFHDLEFDEYPGRKTFNVDHVVVGPGGLFAIETKTRSKPAIKVGDRSPNIVVFDGTALEYPWGREDFGIRDAGSAPNICPNGCQKACKPFAHSGPFSPSPAGSSNAREKAICMSSAAGSSASFSTA